MTCPRGFGWDVVDDQTYRVCSQTLVPKLAGHCVGLHGADKESSSSCA